MAAFKVSRGSYAKIKNAIGKNPDTLYFGYDSANLMGIFLGDKELTPAIRDVKCSKNKDDERYLDLSVTSVNDEGKLVKTIYRINNSPLIDDNIKALETMVGTLRSEINDVSTRFNNFKSLMELSISTITTNLNDTSSNLSKKINAVDSKLKSHIEDASAKFGTIDSKFNTVDSKFNTADSKFNTVDSKFNTIDSRFKDVSTKFNQVDTSINNIHIEGGSTIINQTVNWIDLD